ncbi:hypothetical protein ACQV2W_08885 [Facklamia sp. P12934]
MKTRRGNQAKPGRTFDQFLLVPKLIKISGHNRLGLTVFLQEK